MMFQYPVRMSWDIGKNRSYYFDVMDDLAHTGVFFIGFSGNPFEWEEFPELLKRGAEKSIWGMASTSVWDEKTVDIINRSEIGEVTLTIDFETDLNQCENALSALKKPANVSLSLKDIDVKKTLHRIEALAALPSNRIYLAPYFRYQNPPLSEKDKKKYIRVVNQVMNLRKTRHIIIQDPVACPLTEVLYAEGHSTMCPAGTSTCHLSGELDVYPCPRWGLLCGSMKEQSMMTIWKESETLQSIRNLSLKGVSCPYFSQCLGGCRAVVDKAGLSLGECDPDCLIKVV
jgi:radical SAM protein with 4Fe4S-binding SPASM domain